MDAKDIEKYKGYAVDLIRHMSGAYTDESLARLLTKDSNSCIGQREGLKPISYEDAFGLVQNLIHHDEAIHWRNFSLGRFGVEQRLTLGPDVEMQHETHKAGLRFQACPDHLS